MTHTHFMRILWSLNFFVYAYAVPLDYARGEMLTFAGIWDTCFLFISIFSCYLWWILKSNEELN